MGEDEQRRGRPRDHQRQNQQVRDVAKRNGLTRREHQTLSEETEHRNRVLGDDLGFWDIQALADELVAARRR